MCMKLINQYIAKNINEWSAPTTHRSEYEIEYSDIGVEKSQYLGYHNDSRLSMKHTFHALDVGKIITVVTCDNEKYMWYFND